MSATVYSSVATIDVIQLTNESSLIVVAEVISIKKVSGVKVASIKPLSFIKGVSRCPIAFVAEPTWKCDISDAKSGERVLLYLSPIKPGSGSTLMGQNLNGVASTLSSTNGAQLYILSHSGRGRIPLKRIGKEWIAPVDLLPYDDKPSLKVNLSVPKSIPIHKTSNGNRFLKLKQLIDLA